MNIGNFASAVMGWIADIGSRLNMPQAARVGPAEGSAMVWGQEDDPDPSVFRQLLLSGRIDAVRRLLNQRRHRAGLET